MTDAQFFIVVWASAVVFLALLVVLHSVAHWFGRLCGEWLADHAERRRIARRRENVTRLPALTQSRRRRP
ncbi:MAG: hypothetical protein ACYDC2_11780 [Solirubrobacteraceae bacterium]